MVNCMAEYSDASLTCSDRYQRVGSLYVPSDAAVETRWAAVRARLHTGTTTYVGTCSFRAPDRSTLRSGSRLLAASTAIQRPSP